jgi:hypothetical protein
MCVGFSSVMYFAKNDAKPYTAFAGFPSRSTIVFGREKNARKRNGLASMRWMVST